MKNYSDLIPKNKKNNINWEIQKNLREKIEITDSFEFSGQKIHFSLTSDNGMVFEDQGLEQYHYQGYLNNQQGKKIYYQYWLVDPMWPTVFFVHGNAENSCSHPYFFYWIIKNNFNIIAFDQIGYGNSDGIRGVLDTRYSYFDNIDLVYKFYFTKIQFLRKGAVKLSKKREEISDPEFYFIGFSMGGYQALYYYLFFAKQCDQKRCNSIKKVILLNPWLNNHKRIVSPIQGLFLKLFRNSFNPYMIMRQDSQEVILNGDENTYIKFYRNLTDNDRYLKRRFRDTRIHRLASKYWLGQIKYQQDQILQGVKKIAKLKGKDTGGLLYKKAIYIFIGTNDTIVDNERTKKVAQILNFDKKTKQARNFYELENYFHDFLDYPEPKIKVFNEVFHKILFDK